MLRRFDPEEGNESDPQPMVSHAERIRKDAQSRRKRKEAAPVLETEDFPEVPPHAMFLLERYQQGLVRLTFAHWQLLIGSNSSKHLRCRLVLKFMFCVPLSHQNSSRQLLQRETAEGFLNRRLWRIGWTILLNSLMKARAAEALVPVAQEHYRRKFIGRVGCLIFSSVREYATNRRRKRSMKARGDIGYSDHLRWIGWDSLKSHRARRSDVRQQLRLGADHSHRRSLRTKWSKYLNQIVNRSYEQRLYNQAIQHRDKVMSSSVFERLKLFALHRLEIRQSLSLAQEFKRKSGYKLGIESLIQNGSILEYRMRQMRAVYRSQLLKKAVLGLKLNKFMAEQRIPPSLNLLGPLRHASAIKIQSIVRGYNARRRARRYRVNRVTASLVLQKAARRLLARKAKRALYRHMRTRDLHRAEYEISQMWREDTLVRYMKYREAAALKIQTAYRGYEAREIRRSLKIRAVKDVAIKAHQDIRRQLEVRRRRIAEEPKRFRIRNEAGIIIQKCWRGVMSRKTTNILRREFKISACVSTLQRLLRIRLAKRRLEGLRRAHVNNERIHAATRFKASILRVFGIMTKRKQVKALQLLEAFGLHPNSFDYDIRSLIRETITEGYSAFRAAAKFFWFIALMTRYK